MSPVSQPFQKVVLRFRDGEMEKTQTFRHFSVSHASIQVVGTDGKVRFVKLQDLKAVFFVKRFEGDPEYREKKDVVLPQGPRAGNTVAITLFDGEKLAGKSINPKGDRNGLFLFPSDPNSNNERIFVPHCAIETIIIDGEAS